MKVEREMKIEIIKDTSMQDDLARARRRQRSIVANSQECELAAFAPNAARDNAHPAMPCPDYGDRD